ncbi:hypothetical protein WN55_03798 [Dufourea novaeangliae]|uniref:Uncharacterized protein n=1 Tax=Dufourea novaeangliae TaxID=178035 RepID=A0A154PLE0_DUFNO|nr:hypothetical protein WN55_03798 [Dufourea novaeangliae]
MIAASREVRWHRRQIRVRSHVKDQIHADQYVEEEMTVEQPWNNNYTYNALWKTEIVGRCRGGRLVRSTRVTQYSELLGPGNTALAERAYLNPVRADRLIRIYNEVVSKTPVLTGERDDGVHVDRLHRLAVGRYHCDGVTFDRDLCRTDRSEGIDHSETITTTWSYGEDLQRCVRHETGKLLVRFELPYPELSFSVDQDAFRCLTGVNSETTRETFGRSLVEPIAEQNNVSSQIVVVQVTVSVLARWLTYNDASIKTVYFLQASMGVPEMRTLVASHPLIPVNACVTLLNGTLRHKWYTVVILSSPLPHSVPVNGNFHSFDVILYVDHDLVALANLDAWTRYHSVRRQNASLDTVCQNALTIAPDYIGCIGRAGLTRTVDQSKTSVRISAIQAIGEHKAFGISENSVKTFKLILLWFVNDFKNINLSSRNKNVQLEYMLSE